MRTSLHQRLRAETGAGHQALEDALPISRNCSSARVYRDHLRYLLAFHEVLEPGLQAVPGLRHVLPDLDSRWKTNILIADLGIWASGPRPVGDGVPKPDSLAQGLAVLYVMEGATLGARTLLPRLRAAGVVPGDIGLGYLRGYGCDTGTRFKRVLEALNALPADDEEDVIAWSIATFEALRAWRNEWEQAGQWNDTT